MAAKSKTMLILLTTIMMIKLSLAASPLHQFYSGDCPHLESMTDFNMERFLGQWFVLESTQDNQYVCLREEFNVTKEPATTVHQMRLLRHDDSDNELENEDKSTKLSTIKEKEQDHEKTYSVKRIYLPFGQRQFIEETGKVKFQTNKTMAEMEISFPYSETGMLNLKHYQIVTTDYERFALIWRCQKTIFGHRRQAQLMARKPSLTNDRKTMEEMKTLLRHFEVEHDVKFQPVRQHDCQSVSLEQETSPSKKPSSTNNENSEQSSSTSSSKNKKKLINIDVGGFHLSISYPFW